MGGNLSTPTPTEPQNPNPSQALHSLSSPTPTMPSSDPPNPDPKSPETQNPDPISPQSQNPERNFDSVAPGEKGQNAPASDEEVRESNPSEEGGEEDEDEDGEGEGEGECGFCLFMKGGGCKEQFIAWEKCVEDAERDKEDIVEKCFEVTRNLKTCMDAHSDYYEPILRAEKAAEEEAKKEMEKEAEIAKGGSSEDVVEGKAEIEVHKEEKEN